MWRKYFKGIIDAYKDNNLLAVIALVGVCITGLGAGLKWWDIAIMWITLSVVLVYLPYRAWKTEHLKNASIPEDTTEHLQQLKDYLEKIAITDKNVLNDPRYLDFQNHDTFKEYFRLHQEFIKYFYGYPDKINYVKKVVEDKLKSFVGQETFSFTLTPSTFEYYFNINVTVPSTEVLAVVNTSSLISELHSHVEGKAFIYKADPTKHFVFTMNTFQLMTAHGIIYAFLKDCLTGERAIEIFEYKRKYKELEPQLEKQKIFCQGLGVLKGSCDFPK